MKIYLFRHGQTDWNKEKKIQGATDVPLNAVGREEAKKVGPLLADKNIDLVYTSDLVRAYETGEIVATFLGAQLKATPLLRECSFGEVEGMTIDEVKMRYGEEIWDKSIGLHADSSAFCFPGGESVGDSVARLRELLTQVLKENYTQNIAFSTHGGVLRNFLHSFMPEKEKPLAIPNCVIYELNCEEDLFIVKGPL